MASIKQPITDIVTRLGTMSVSRNGVNETLYTRIWNNQLAYDREGKIYSFPKPAAFLEVINAVTWQEIGKGYLTADLGFNVHLIHEYYNDVNGITFEQDLAVFDLRDQIIALLSNYAPTGCSVLVCNGEQQDYQHDNLYHYIISFVCSFVDSKGSRYDAAAGNYVNSVPNTGLTLTAQPLNDGSIPAEATAVDFVPQINKPY